MNSARRLQQVGGAAGILLGLTLVANLAIFVLYVPTLGVQFEGNPAQNPAKFVDLMAKARDVFFWSDLIMAFAGAAAIALVRALDQRLRSGSPVLGPVGTAYGLLGIGLLVLTSVAALSLGKLFAGSGLSHTQMEQAIPVLFVVLFPALSGSANLLTGAWVMLASAAALRGGGLPPPLVYAGFVIGILLIVQIIAIPAGESILAVWLIWVGVVLLMRPAKNLPQS